MEDTLQGRINRLYAAVGEIEVTDLSKFPVRPITPEAEQRVHDFSGGLSTEGLENLAHSVIATVANLRDHARKFAKRNKRDPEEVTRLVKANPSLSLLIDLAEREKHGDGRRDGGFSGQEPRLGLIVRGLELRPLGRVNVEVRFSESGTVVTPTGHLAVVLNAQILDSAGQTIGYLRDLVKDGLEAWEGLFRAWGIIESAA
jgi:hypothetical protein